MYWYVVEVPSREYLDGSDAPTTRGCAKMVPLSLGGYKSALHKMLGCYILNVSRRLFLLQLRISSNKMEILIFSGQF